MRPALLALLALALPASAQGWDEGVAALVPVDAFERPGDDAVWTDMRPLAFAGSDEELKAATGAALYAGPAPGTAPAEAWHERLGRMGGVVDCSDAATVCAVRVRGEGGRVALLFPFGAESLRLAPGTRMRVVPRLRLTDAQAAALGESGMRALGLVLGDGNTLASGSGSAALVTTQPRPTDCGAPGVRCGVVYEIETTVTGRGLSVLLL